MRKLLFLCCLLFAVSCSETEEISFTEFAEFNRSEVAGIEAAVVSGHPLATAAGFDVLRSGGNAMDAAVTMAAVLAVVRPHMNGVGGDAFALFYDAESRSVSALNGSGRAGNLATPDFVRDAGYERMPQSGAMAVTVPGALSAWAETLNRYGTISLSDALQPAIRYAEEGFPVTPTLYRDFETVVDDLNEAGKQLYTNNGERLQQGERLRNPALANTLRRVADEGIELFYRGEIAEILSGFIEENGGFLRAEDFTTHEASWGESVSSGFKGMNVHVHPPNSQGIALLMQLAMAEELELGAMDHNSAEYIHTLVELKKLAFADRDRWVTDFETNPAPLDELLDESYLKGRAAEVSRRAAAEVNHGFGEVLTENAAEGDGDTVYLMVVDKDGNAVSWIQSLFSSFGSKLVEPETGIVLQNRGGGFTLQDGHPNQIAPGKRPFHTLTPAMVTDQGGNLELTLGTPGGHGQTQFKVQVLYNLYQFGMHPQQAVESAHYRSDGGTRVALENRIAVETRNDLSSRGHDLRIIDGWTPIFGGVQLIWFDNENGGLRTAASPRREAHAIAY
jgi:gamma-glutamyltranspeptidase / glutathione hydrolase